MRLFRTFIFLYIILALSSCALQVPPDGGAKDVSPPKFISSSPPNYSTEFKGLEIRLDFDEYISVTELSSQLIVSPLLKYSTETRMKKKSLFITLQDTLLENTTYTLNFGSGITDNNEGNKLEDFQFVFSTGEVLDSLNISGNLEAAFDKKKEKGNLILLYKDIDDSIPFLQRPLYFTKTNDSGSYKISNVSPGTYKVIGLNDKNGDYLYTQGEEGIAFADSLIESNSSNVNLRIFKEASKLIMLKAYSESPGKAVIAFNGRADTLKPVWLMDTTKLNLFSINYSIEKDSIYIWYKNLLSDSINLYFNNDNFRDTISFRLFKYPSENTTATNFVLTIDPVNLGIFPQHLHLPFSLKSNNPISQADFNNIILLEDSLPVKPKFSFIDSLHMFLDMKHNWISKGKYSLLIPKGTFTDIFGLKNDTIQLSFTTRGESDYGSVTIKMQNVKNPLILQLVNDNGNVFREAQIVQDTAVEFGNLNPLKYRIKIIDDRNQNGKWDSGNYLQHLQPELVFFNTDYVTVRSNWDVEVVINSAQIFLSGR